MKNLNLLDFKNTNCIPFLMSERGMGKTQFVRDYATSNKLDVFTLNLSCIEASDFCGLPYIIDNETKYAKPEFFSLKNAILFLDEMNRVTDIDVKAGLNNLLLDRSINGHKLDDSVLIVGAGNPVNEDYETTEFDTSLQDRIVVIDFYHEFKDFITYLKTSGETPFTKFIENNESIFDDISRRRIFETNKMLVATKNEKYVFGFLGQNIFNLYNAFNSKRLFSLDNILQGEKCNDVIGIQSVTSELISYLLENYDINHSKNINTFLNDIPAESKLLFFKKFKEAEVSKEQIDIFLDSNLFDGLGKYLKELF